MVSTATWADVQCLGSNCYQSDQVPLKLEEIVIDATLNLDESIDYSETLGLVYNFSGDKYKSLGVMLPEFSLPAGELYPEINVSYVIGKHGLTRVYSFTSDNCSDEFVYNPAENTVELCLLPEDQSRIRIETTILSSMDLLTYEQYQKKTDYVANQINITLPASKNGYLFSMKIEGGVGVLIQNITGTICKDITNDTTSASTMRLIPTVNGIICQGTIVPSDGKPANKVLAIQGLNEQKIIERNQEQLTVLQNENINASIRASNAVVSATNATFLNVILTIAIALFTAGNVYATILVTREGRKMNKPFIKVKIDPHGTDQVIFKVVNVGKSSAVDVNLEYEIIPGGGTHKWQHHLMQENEATHIIPRNLKDMTLTKFLDTYERMIIRSTWNDPHQNKYRDEYEINLKEYKQSIEHNHQVWEKALKNGKD